MGSESLISGLKGTPHWMAPEVIKGQQSENGWGNADIWSVGCTVVEMLTAQMPWSIYPNPMAAMYHIANGERPPLPKEIESSIPPECKNFIFDCCCNVDPLKRSTVFALLEHPWLVQALESAAMADAEGSRTWLPGPIDFEKKYKKKAAPVNEKEVEKDKENEKDKKKEKEKDKKKEKDKEQKDTKKKKSRRKLPNTPSNGDVNDNNNDAPEMPARPAKRKDKNSERPLPVAAPPAIIEARPLNPGSKTERDTTALNSNQASPDVSLNSNVHSNSNSDSNSNTNTNTNTNMNTNTNTNTNPDDVNDLKRMMEEQNRKTLLLQQQIDQMEFQKNIQYQENIQKQAIQHQMEQQIIKQQQVQAHQALQAHHQQQQVSEPRAKRLLRRAK